MSPRSTIFVFVTFVLVSTHVVVQSSVVGVKCPHNINYFCACNSTGPPKLLLIKMCLSRSNQSLVCAPCPMKYQTYLNCSECSTSECPVCEEHYFNELHFRIASQHPEDHAHFTPHLKRLFITTPNSSYNMQTHNMYHLPLLMFNNSENGLKHFGEFQRILILRVLKMIEMLNNFHSARLLRDKLKVVKIQDSTIIIPYNIDHFSEIQKMGKMVDKFYDTTNFSEEHENFKSSLYIINGRNNGTSSLRLRRLVDGTGDEDDDIFGRAYKSLETPEEMVTESLRTRHGRTVLNLDTVTEDGTTKHFRRTRRPSAGKKHFHHRKKGGIRGKSHREFNKNKVPKQNRIGNRKHKNGGRNFKAKFKNADLAQMSHLNETLFDKQTTDFSFIFDELNRNGSYIESNKRNTTNIRSEDDVSLSNIFTDVSATSSFLRNVEFTEDVQVPNSLYNKQFREHISHNSSPNGKSPEDEDFITEHNLSSHLYDRESTEPESNLKLLPIGETFGNGNLSILPSYIFRSQRLNDTSYSTDFLTDTDMSSKETYTQPKRNDQSTINTSLITRSHFPEEARGEIRSTENENFGSNNTENPFFISSSVEGSSDDATDRHHFGEKTFESAQRINKNLEYEGLKNTDNSKNMLSHVTDNELRKSNLSITPKEENITNKSEMTNRSEFKLLITSSYESDLNHTTGQHLLNSTRSGILTDIGETVSVNKTDTFNKLKNMSSTNILEEQLPHTDLLTLVQSKDNNTRNAKSEKSNETVSTMLSSLLEQDSSLQASKGISENIINGSTIAVNNEIISSNESDVYTLLPIQPVKMTNTPTTGENVKLDEKKMNSRNPTASSSRISLSKNETEIYSVDDMTSAYTLKNNQTLKMKRNERKFTTVISGLKDQQQEDSDSQTFIDSKSYNGNGMHFRNTMSTFISSNENETIQTVLGKISESLIHGNRTPEANPNETLDDIFKKFHNPTENNNTFEALKDSHFNFGQWSITESEESVNGYGRKTNFRNPEGTETSNRNTLNGNFDNENKGSPFSYETIKKIDEKNQTSSYKHNDMFNDPTTIVLYYTAGELNTTSYKKSDFDPVEEVNFKMFEDSKRIDQRNISGNSTEDKNIHVSLYYRATNYDDDINSSTKIKPDDVIFNTKKTTVNIVGSFDNNSTSTSLGMRHLDVIRLKRDNTIEINGNKSIENGTKIDAIQNSRNFEELSTPQSMIERNTVGHRKEKDFYISKQSEALSSLVLDSSANGKKQHLFYNGMTKKAEKSDKEIMKKQIKKLKYKNQKDQVRGDKVDYFSNMSPNFTEDRKTQSKLIKDKKTLDDYQKDADKKHLEANRTSSSYDKNHQFSHFSRTWPESTKQDIKTSENGKKTYKGIGENHNTEYYFSKNKHRSLVKENSKSSSVQKMDENEKSAEERYISSKFRPGRKLFQFSKTGDDKQLLIRFWNSPLKRNRRSVNDLPESDWCPVPAEAHFASLECNVWTYQKVCVMTCTKDNNVQGSSQAVFKCARRKNVWEPKMQSCAGGEGIIEDIDLKALQKNSPNESNKKAADSRKSDKSQKPVNPSNEYEGHEEYDEYEYKEEGGDHLTSDKKSSGQKSQPKKVKDDEEYDYNDLAH